MPKADNVRLVGREGVKIVTGKVFSSFGGEEQNSLGGNIAPAPKIDLVAGNNYDKVQGVALGEKTAECLTEFKEIVEKLGSSIFKLAVIQASLDGVIGVDPVRPWVPAAATPAQMKIVTDVLMPVWQTLIDSAMWEANFLRPPPLGHDYIVSTNVRTN